MLEIALAGGSGEVRPHILIMSAPPHPHRLRRLTPDERLLFHHIDQAQNEGVWSKALRARTNFSPQMLTKCLKSLESKDLVQSVMSVKFPNRKMYLLKHLKPSEDVAGGPWQTEGEFDTALIEIACKAVESLVQRETCIMVPAGYNNYAPEDRSEAIAAKKAHVQAGDIEDLGVKPFRPPMKPRLVPRHEVKYPTAASLRDALMSTGIIRDKEVQESDMEQLLEMMVLDSRLEKISGTNYRLATKAMSNTERWNGFVDAPCGTCPVFDLCGDGGAISARTCVYFGEWLETDSQVHDQC